MSTLVVHLPAPASRNVNVTLFGRASGGTGNRETSTAQLPSRGEAEVCAVAGAGWGAATNRRIAKKDRITASPAGLNAIKPFQTWSAKDDDFVRTDCPWRRPGPVAGDHAQEFRHQPRVSAGGPLPPRPPGRDEGARLVLADPVRRPRSPGRHADHHLPARNAGNDHARRR